MGEFKIRYPGVYDETEAKCLAQYDEHCRAINQRGPVDIQALIAGTLPPDTPGIGPVIHATEEMVRYCNGRFDPFDPLYNDRDYAIAAGYKDIPAMITFAAHDDSYIFPIPAPCRDRLLATGNNHCVISYRPIYPGDTLYLTVDDHHYTDLTPQEGSIYRTMGLYAAGSVYNQRGELVNKLSFHVRENLKTYEDDARPEHVEAWEGPPWTSRPEHRYTDADWDFIRDVWSKEYIRGAEPLYWEDVSIGDEPAWTLDGPIDDTLEPLCTWGQGIGGSRTLKREIMDPEIFKTMKRNPYDGIYRLEKRSMSYCAPPAGEPMFDKMGNPYDPMAHASFADNDDPMCQPPERAVLVNFMGRDFALRHIANWMGDHGQIRKIAWAIMNDDTLKNYGYIIPPSPEAVRFLDVIPELRDKCLHHGLERDICLIKSRVYDKHVENGEHMVELVWWIETILGEIYEEGHATVILPSRGE